MTVSAYLDYLRPFYPTWDRALEAEILGQFRLPPERRIKRPFPWDANEDGAGVRLAVPAKTAGAG